MNSQSNNDISALRDVLFKTLRGLQDGSIKPDLAEAINATGQTIINSAKVEVEFLKATGASSDTGFIPLLGEKPVSNNTPTGTKTIVGGTIQHRMR